MSEWEDRAWADAEKMPPLKKELAALKEENAAAATLENTAALEKTAKPEVVENELTESDLHAKLVVLPLGSSVEYKKEEEEDDEVSQMRENLCMQEVSKQRSKEIEEDKITIDGNKMGMPWNKKSDPSYAEGQEASKAQGEGNVRRRIQRAFQRRLSLGDDDNLFDYRKWFPQTPVDARGLAKASLICLMTETEKRLVLAMYLTVCAANQENAHVCPARSPLESGQRSSPLADAFAHPPLLLSRILASYDSLAEHPHLLVSVLFQHFGNLRELGLLRFTGSIDQVSDQEIILSCRVGLSLARACAKELNIELTRVAAHRGFSCQLEQMGAKAVKAVTEAKKTSQLTRSKPLSYIRRMESAAASLRKRQRLDDGGLCGMGTAGKLESFFAGTLRNTLNRETYCPLSPPPSLTTYPPFPQTNLRPPPPHPPLP